MNEGTDFIVSELLSELKADGIRKDAQIERLHKQMLKVVLAAFLVVIATVAVFLWYLNQYDFSSTQTVEQIAEGVYAIIDSEGNTIACDISPEELMEMINYGESEIAD